MVAARARWPCEDHRARIALGPATCGEFVHIAHTAPIATLLAILFELAPSGRGAGM